MWQFALLVGSSFGLGALHAVEPGHGKTVVAAYLIGSKGRISDAILLGLVVTATHSGSVIILGVLSAVAAAVFVPETVQKVLEIVSGLLVLGVGGWMLVARLRRARGDSSVHEHPHPHPHPSEPDSHHAADESAHAQTHEHVSGDEADHPHDHAHPHEELHEHSHGGHGHSHGPVAAPGQRPTLGQLVALGVSGGIVPCPAALAVLLAAASYGQLAQGIALVLVFSLGMAAVLVAIGIMMVKAAGLAGRYVSESRWTKVVPIFSAALITLLGVALTARALVVLWAT
jgi:nickel/cobalt transporter (NicO) family protein